MFFSKYQVKSFQALKINVLSAKSRHKQNVLKSNHLFKKWKLGFCVIRNVCA